MSNTDQHWISGNGIIVICLAVFISLLNCEGDSAQKEAVEALVQETLANKIESYQTIRLRRCREDMFEVASQIADSLLLEDARNARDTSNKPAVPLKPNQPIIVEVEDTTPIAPFLERDSLKK